MSGFVISMIQNVSLNNIKPNSYCTPVGVSFKQNPVQTLTHTNIGSCLEGFIGKVCVRNSKNENVFLNVFKKFESSGIENYTIQNDKGDIVGMVDLAVKKLAPNWECADPSHVFVDNLRNFSNPNTPYYKQGLEYYKDIGTRLLQIAQRRSDEACCNGNIKLISKGESLNWYKQAIGMRQEFPPVKGMIQIHNPNQLYLPPENKEPLSKLRGGL